MRIKTQLLISIITFSIILVIIGSSVALTQVQITELNNQSVLTNEIQTGASNLNYISNNYFLYQDNSYITLWQTKFSTLSNEIATLNSTNPQQQALVNTVSDDMENLNTVFAGVTTFLSSAPRNESIRVLPSFQTQWNRMAVQIQALAFDSQQLSQNIQDQTNQAILINTILTIALLSLFGAFFITIYLVTYRGTVRSIAKLKNGIMVIGSGHLGYTIEAGKKDEIADISKSVNQMAANLKTVTASKTDLEMAQTSLLESEARLNRSQEIAHLGGWELDLVKDKLTWSDEVYRIFGLKPQEFDATYEAFLQAVHPDDREAVDAAYSGSLRDGRDTYEIEHRVVRKSTGEIRIVHEKAEHIRDKQGKIIRSIGMVHDITELKKAEESLQKQAALIDLSPDAIIVKDLNDIIKFWSDGAEKLYGYSGAQAIGQNAGVLLLAKFPEKLEKIVSQLERDGRWSGEVMHQTKAGHEVVVQSHWLMKTNENGEREIFESNVDITERRMLQEKLEESAVRVEEYATQMEELANKRAEQLKDAERLATIGATAGMVGHDIRNPLQAITSDVYLVKTELNSTSESEEKKNALESLTEIEKNVDYINKIVADLQDFARPLKPHIEEADLKLIIDDLLRKNGLPKNVKVNLKVESNVRKVVADSAYLNRIMYNLVTNAVQAMPKGGKLTIQAYKEANDAIITVEDT